MPLSPKFVSQAACSAPHFPANCRLVSHPAWPPVETKSITRDLRIPPDIRATERAKNYEENFSCWKVIFLPASRYIHKAVLMNSPRDIDWTSLLTRLVDRAIKWFQDERCFGEDSVLPGTSQSAIDLAQNALLEFFNGKKVQWRPKSPDEDPFPLVLKVMRHDFLDLIKRKEYRQTVILDATRDGEGRSELENLPGKNDGFVSAEAASLARSLYPLIKGDQGLKDLIDAVCILGLRKREEIAEFLGVSPQEITDCQRRLDDERIYSILKAERGAEQANRRTNV